LFLFLSFCFCFCLFVFVFVFLFYDRISYIEFHIDIDIKTDFGFREFT
jgi:hypothetical protein